MSFVVGHPQKKRLSPIVNQVKSVKGVSCVDQLSFVQNVTNVPVVSQNFHVGSRLHQFEGNMGRPRGQPQDHKNPQRRLHSCLLDRPTNDKVTPIIMTMYIISGTATI